MLENCIFIFLYCFLYLHGFKNFVINLRLQRSHIYDYIFYRFQKRMDVEMKDADEVSTEKV